MFKFLEEFLSLIYSHYCHFCHKAKEDKVLCSRCYRKIHFMPPAVMREIKNCPVYSTAIYDGIIKTLILDLKYHNKKYLAKTQAELMFNYWKQLNINGDFLLVPVPIHKERKKERKYNHMDLVADEFSLLSGFNEEKNLIVRVKDTQKQFKLKRQDRIQNIKNAFEINPKNEIPKETKILVLDDITSTGITLEEIIRILKEAGFKDITALTLATPDIWN